MTAPRVSVLIPTYNRVDLVPGAVASVLEQTMVDFEVVVVVDGSTDGTADALRSQFDDSRLRIVEQENRGLAQARDAGVGAARGELVALLDDDDRCLPRRLELQVQALDACPEAALCLANVVYEGSGVRADAPTLHAQPHYRSPDSLAAVFEGAWTLPSGMMFRPPVLRELGFDASIRYQEDTDFLFRFHRAGLGVVALPDVLVRYATQSGAGAGRLSEGRAQMDESYARIYARHWDEVSPEARAGVRRPVEASRRLARYHLARGDWGRARKAYFACWGARPWRIRPLLRGLRCLVPWGARAD